MNLHYRRHLPFIFVVLLFIIVAFLDRLLPEGMFSDGLLYAAIGRNMAQGMGSFWVPYVGHGAYFWEHPPLMMGMESVFYRILGDHYSTEKIYCFVVWLVNVLLIRKLWRIDADAERRPLYWLPLLMWSLSPTVLWTYPNNGLECTMAIFDMAAVLFAYKACRQMQGRYYHIAFAALCVILATLTKGPVGFFPLAVPVVYSIAFRGNIKAAVINTLLLFVMVTAAYLLLISFNTPRYALGRYLDQQLFSSLAGQREQVDSSLGRLNIFKLLLMQVGPAAGITLLLFAVARIFRVKAAMGIEKKLAVFFLLTGICASLPIIISIKQSSFYLVPSIPFYAIGFALLAYPFISGLIARYTMPAAGRRVFGILAVIAVIVCAIYLWPKANTVGREQELLADVKHISTIIKPREVVSICPAMVQDYTFSAYAERYGKIEMRPFEQHKYIIVSRDLCWAFGDSLSAHGYIRVNLPTQKYDLYKQQ